MEVYVDDEAKLTLHGLQQHYVKLKENEKNKKLFELLDVLEFNQVSFLSIPAGLVWFIENQEKLYGFFFFFENVRNKSWKMSASVKGQFQKKKISSVAQNISII